ncbi:MAG: aspartyl protease family protein, partial [Woeseiaceae bacterium]|nr:aspartyl protease family protein [Woeseiaceae bacterium]
MRAITLVLVLCLYSPASADVSNWVPVEINNGQVILPVMLDGQPASALLDTGSSGHGISEKFLASHEGTYARGRRVTVRGIKEDRDTSMINGVSLGIFGVEFTMNQLLPIKADDVDFVLGLPFFDLFIVQIDYPNRRMRIINRDSLDLRKFSNVKMMRAGGVGHPQVRVNLNGEYKGWLMLDTGNNGPILLRRSIAERNGWLDKYPTIEGTTTGVNDVAAGIQTFSLPSMTIGPVELENVMISVPVEGEELQLSRFDPIVWSTGTNIKRAKKTDGI